LPKNTAQIGKADERMIVNDLEKLGYRARRQPGSGNRAVDLQHDVVWQDSPVGRLHIESKYRRDSQWKRLETYRAGADILTLRCDQRLSGQDGQRMVFMSWELFLDLVGEQATEAAPLKAEFDSSGKMIGMKPKRKIQSQGFQKGHRPMRRA